MHIKKTNNIKLVKQLKQKISTTTERQDTI